MGEINLPVPDEARLAFKGTSESVAPELRLSEKVKLQEMGWLFSGAAAILAGIPRTLFLPQLVGYGVSTFDLTKEELARDFESAQGAHPYSSTIPGLKSAGAPSRPPRQALGPPS